MAARRRRRAEPAQAWIELRADDPDALSTLEVARAHLPAGRDLERVRRLRLFELGGAVPAPGALEELLHRSTQFYNPHKERCVVRRGAEAAPAGDDEWVVLVVERGGDRRPAAERWWHHVTGERIEVREGVAWALRFRRASAGAAAARDLAELRDRSHGLLCNPHAQDWAVARGGAVPLPWWSALGRAAEGKGETT